MLVDVDVPFSDAWWLRTLSRKFVETPKRPNSRIGNSRRADMRRNEWLDMLWCRLTGDTPLLRVNDRYAEATREFMRLTRTMYGATVVGAVQERTHFLGAMTTAPDGSDADGDETVRAFMEGNGTFFADALTYAYTMGVGGVIVGEPQEGEQFATATAEDPRQLVWSVDPVRPLKVRAALKVYRDDDLNETVAHLMLSPTKGAVKGEPESFYRVRVARRFGPSPTGIRFSPAGWEWDDDPKVSGPLPMELQEFGLPVVPLVNRYGLGEFEPVIDLLDRIHNDIADRLWTQKYQTFLQRALIGNLPANDKAGNPIDYDDLFSSDPGALWRMPAGSEIWESKQADLAGLLSGQKADLMELSATTSTPMFMFTPDATGQSAEGADVARETSVNKARDRVNRFGPGSNRVARLGLAYSGQIEVARREVRPVWAPVREFSLQQRGSAAVQAKQSGVPQRSILSEIWQFDPSTVARMETERNADLLFATPAPPVQTSTPNGPEAAPPPPAPASTPPIADGGQSAT